MGSSPYRRILLIVVAIILYGSFYPWHFHARRLGAGPLWILLHSWPAGLSRYLVWDVAVNLALYLPVGVFGFLSVSERAPRTLRFCAPLLLALLLSASVEMIQLFDPSRDCSASDVAANVTGAAVGIGLGALYRGRLQRALRGRESVSFLHPSAALLVLCCWLGYQVFPLFPALGRTKLAIKLAAFGPLSTISFVQTLLVFAEWLAVAGLLEGMLERNSRRVLPLLFLVPLTRLLIVDRTLGWPDVAGAAAAYAVWLGLPRLYVRRATPLLLAGSLILGELAPFHFTRAAAFNWVPFRGFFEAAWQSGFIVLFRKSFWYGAVIWLWGTAGYGLVRAASATAAALFLLERLQVFLPGRVPEITDTVLAVLIGVVLWHLDDRLRPAADGPSPDLPRPGTAGSLR